MVKLNTILLKISGESLSGDQEHGLDNDVLHSLSLVIKKVIALGIKVGIVVGGEIGRAHV